MDEARAWAEARRTEFEREHPGTTFILCGHELNVRPVLPFLDDSRPAWRIEWLCEQRTVWLGEKRAVPGVVGIFLAHPDGRFYRFTPPTSLDVGVREPKPVELDVLEPLANKIDWGSRSVAAGLKERPTAGTSSIGVFPVRLTRLLEEAELAALDRAYSRKSLRPARAKAERVIRAAVKALERLQAIEASAPLQAALRERHDFTRALSDANARQRGELPPVASPFEPSLEAKKIGSLLALVRMAELGVAMLRRQTRGKDGRPSPSREVEQQARNAGLDDYEIGELLRKLGYEGAGDAANRVRVRHQRATKKAKAKADPV